MSRFFPNSDCVQVLSEIWQCPGFDRTLAVFSFVRTLTVSKFCPNSDCVRVLSELWQCSGFARTLIVSRFCPNSDCIQVLSELWLCPGFVRTLTVSRFVRTLTVSCFCLNSGLKQRFVHISNVSRLSPNSGLYQANSDCLHAGFVRTRFKTRLSSNSDSVQILSELWSKTRFCPNSGMWPSLS